MEKLIVITGPTACGKTKMAVDLAALINGEIVSADSRQVYKHMDIGTGKDLVEYGDIPYHLIDICPAGSKYNLHRYLRDFKSAVNDIHSRGKNVIVCGGTGLYLESALSGISTPEVPQNIKLRDDLSKKSLDELTQILQSYKTLHNKTDIDTCKRAIRAIEIEEYYRQNPAEAAMADKNRVQRPDAIIFALDIPRELRRERISRRLDQRLKEGMLEEVQSLLNSGIPPEDLIYYGLEYKYLTLYLTGKLDYQHMHDLLEIEIHKFAKRQMTWFRGMERRGYNLIWVPYNLPANKLPLF